jgi:hypothetical protein
MPYIAALREYLTTDRFEEEGSPDFGHRESNFFRAYTNCDLRKLDQPAIGLHLYRCLSRSCALLQWAARGFPEMRSNPPCVIPAPETFPGA